MKRSLLSITKICLAVLLIPVVALACKKKKTSPPVVIITPPVTDTAAKTDVLFYLTKADQTALFQKQNIGLLFAAGTAGYPVIDVDTTQIFQSIDGFGYTLTGGSATLINALPAIQKDDLLRDLFQWDSTHIGVSYLRISIGASDLSATTFTYDDVPAGQTDSGLTQFSIDAERTDLIPILKKILAINPSIKIMGSPWSAPVWMKTGGSFKGGSLKPEYYNAYAKYLVKYIQAMKAEGITIDAITPQNEPLHGGNNPSMVMLATEQRDFIKNSLGPAFKNAGLNTKIIAYDHNADKPDYPITIFNDTAAAKYVDGSAFHLYGGTIDALGQVHNAYPNKHVYFTEQWVGGPANFGSNLSWHVENLIIGATRNWSRNVLEWNLAADPFYNPHTVGGCTTCLGAITVNGPAVTRNVAYYIIASASKFVRPGSVRIASNNIGNLVNVAFKNPAGKKILIVLNKGNSSEAFHIRSNGKMVTTQLDGGAVGTYVW
ncbi:MAG: glycoside hydrolase family 30 beta sandwich domain-containing protein [Bacteroidota bacterium]